MKINLFGAGRVASHLAKAFVEAGHDLAVWNRSEASLNGIRKELSCLCVTDINQLPSDADVFIISVKDDAISSVAEKIKSTFGSTNAIVAHTAGSVSLDTLKSSFSNCGVFYPMQTFTKEKQLDYSLIPFFVEEEGCKLEELAKTISQNVYRLNGEQRKYLHLASVFACNFANHCYAIAETILKSAEIPFSVMTPLIMETATKSQTLSPLDGQTGPAIREDYNIMNMQMDLLKDSPELQEIYRLMSDNIIRYKQ